MAQHHMNQNGNKDLKSQAHLQVIMLVFANLSKFQIALYSLILLQLPLNCLQRIVYSQNAQITIKEARFATKVKANVLKIEFAVTNPHLP